MDILPGEPVLLSLQITNISEEPITVGFGQDGVQAVAMELREESGKIVSGPTAIPVREGLAEVGDVVIMPGATVEKGDLVLNRWVSTSVPEGRYRVICCIDPVGWKQRVVLATTMTVRKPDDELLNRKLAELADRVFHPRPGEPRFRLAGEMLCFTDAVESICYKVRIGRELQGQLHLQTLVIEGLGRIGTVEAARELMELAEDPTFEFPPKSGHEQLRRAAVVAVYKLRDSSNDPGIQAATEEFAKKHERPFEATHHPREKGVIYFD